MSVTIIKGLILAEDFEYGFESTLQDRGGSQFNSGYIPFSLTESVEQALNARYTSAYMNTNFANIVGNTSQVFNVANAVLDTEAVNLGQVNASLALKADQLYTDNQLALKANLNGSSSEEFNTLGGTNPKSAVNFTQLDLKEDKTVVATKADISNVIEKDSSISYSPLFDYNPANKKYVDDSIHTAFQTGVSGSFTASSGETITVTNGLITGII